MSMMICDAIKPYVVHPVDPVVHHRVCHVVRFYGLRFYSFQFWFQKWFGFCFWGPFQGFFQWV